MSTVATVSDLATFMNVTLDDTRAQQMLDIVEAFAMGIVSPLPPSAKGVILTASARALANPPGVTSQSEAGSSVSWGSGGPYLSKSERAMLARLGGIGGGAFSVNMAPDAGKYYRDPLRPMTLDDREEFALDQDLP